MSMKSCKATEFVIGRTSLTQCMQGEICNELRGTELSAIEAPFIYYPLNGWKGKERVSSVCKLPRGLRYGCSCSLVGTDVSSSLTC